MMNPDLEALHETLVELRGGMPIAEAAKSLGTGIWLLSRHEDPAVVAAAREEIDVTLAHASAMPDRAGTLGALMLAKAILGTAAQALDERRIGKAIVDADLLAMAMVISRDPLTEPRIAELLAVSLADVENGLEVLRGLGILHAVRGMEERTWVLTQPGRRAVEDALAPR